MVRPPQHTAGVTRQIVRVAGGLMPKPLLAAAPEISVIEHAGGNLSTRSGVRTPIWLHKAVSRYTRHAKSNIGVETFLY